MSFREIGHRNYPYSVPSRFLFHCTVRCSSHVVLVWGSSSVLYFWFSVSTETRKCPLQGCSASRCLLLFFILPLTSTASLSPFVFLAPITFDITARLFFRSKILPRYVNCVDSKVTRILLKKNERITKAVAFVLIPELPILITILLFTTTRPIPLFPDLFSVKSRLVAYRKYSSPSLPLPSTMFIEFPSPLPSRPLVGTFNMFRTRMQGNLNIYSLS